MSGGRGRRNTAVGSPTVGDITIYLAQGSVDCRDKRIILFGYATS